MRMKAMTALALAALCLLLPLGSMAETRQGVIWLEGQEEIIEETLFESPLGFSFWYANDTLEAYHGEADNIEGVIVHTIYSDDYMVLSMISEEEAAEYTEDCEESIVDQAAEARVQTDLYWDLEDGRYYFCTLIGENGQYLRAVGEYSQEAAEGNAKYFLRVLDSISFMPGCLIRAAWGAQEEGGEGKAQVILIALEPVTDAALLRLEWEDVSVSWAQAAPIGSLDAGQSVTVSLEFIGDLPNNGVTYTDADGNTRFFALDISGEDGDMYFWDLEE